MLLARYSLPPDGREPPTLVMGIWHAGFSARKRNPFACCYYRDIYCDYNACEYLRQFGSTREEQARNYYLWAQTIPLPMWRYLKQLPLTTMTEFVADAVPPLAVANLLRYLDVAHFFRGAVVLDLFAGICGWLMAFFFYPSHALPRRWIAVDIDARRLAVCRQVGRELGVDVVVVRRDLAAPWSPPRVDVVVGSPPCHEFSTAKPPSARKEEDGLRLVRRFFDLAETVDPALAIMEEAASVEESDKALEWLALSNGWHYGRFVLREHGAIQHRRRRFFAWRL
jgi:predicted RNA methylase